MFMSISIHSLPCSLPPSPSSPLTLTSLSLLSYLLLPPFHSPSLPLSLTPFLPPSLPPSLPSFLPPYLPPSISSFLPPSLPPFLPPSFTSLPLSAPLPVYSCPILRDHPQQAEQRVGQAGHTAAGGHAEGTRLHGEGAHREGS